MGNTIEIILTVIGLSFWILFPIGMFLSVSKIDSIEQKNGIRHRIQEMKERHFDWHHPFANVGRWFQHH